ncbi:MAG: hypothetical protein K6G76_03295 [Lachnospiraceae bacterium]|nr:hypothetical protein [Lachnospiraceae bacterium]
MMKEVLAVGSGVIVGAAICYGGYCLLKYHSKKSDLKEDDIFAEKIRKKEEQENKLHELLSRQVHIELLTARELTTWFKDNRNSVPKNAKMIIVTPTFDNMRGLGYYGDYNFDLDTNLVQVFYDDESGEVYKIRLVSFTNIESNLQANLIEQDGMMVVTE